MQCALQLNSRPCDVLCRRRFRKLVLAAVVVLLATVPEIQLMTALGVTVVFWVVHNAAVPYAHDVTDRLESLALFTQSLTLFLGLVRAGSATCVRRTLHLTCCA